MDTRTVSPIVVGSSIAGASLAAFVAYRYYLRQRTLQELQATQGAGVLATARAVSAGLGVRLNLPTPTELATALVPIFSLATPYEAIEDVLANGRQSAFWPANYREVGALGRYESVVFDMLDRVYKSERAESA
jgi:hypothetical protein